MSPKLALFLKKIRINLEISKKNNNFANNFEIHIALRHISSGTKSAKLKESEMIYVPAICVLTWVSRVSLSNSPTLFLTLLACVF